MLTKIKLKTFPEKGILKKHGYGLVHSENNKDKWGEDHGDNMELMVQQQQQDGGGMNSGVVDVERTLRSLNGYHEDILEALKTAAASQSHRGTGAGNTPSGSGSISEEQLRKTLQECSVAAMSYGEYKRSSSKNSSKENICDNMQPHTVLVESGQGGLGGGGVGVGGVGTMLHQQHRPHNLHQDDDDTPATGPLRIRNLEDLIRQLEHHSARQMSPSCSEDIRMSETEADRHYRLDSSAACSESSQGLVFEHFAVLIAFN